MPSRRNPVSPLYLLERFEPGIVQLDDARRVVGMNDFARRALPVDEKRPFDQMVLDFHPERSRAKVEFLLDQARQCPVAAPPPMTMIINIPERVLLIKVSRMTDAELRATGYALVFRTWAGPALRPSRCAACGTRVGYGLRREATASAA